MRIGANIGAFQQRLLTRLSQVNRAIEQSNLRLSTGKRINSAADDPSGIVILSQLRAEQTAVKQSTKNIERSQSLVDTADSALGQVTTHLTTIRSLALDAAGGTLSQAELEANQTEIDAAINAINSLTKTSFEGKRLLDGSHDFVTTGVNTSQVEQLTVLDRHTGATSQAIDVNVTVAAQEALLTYSGGGGATITDDATVTLTGSLGSTTVTVSQSESLNGVRDRINLESGLTGVEATVNGNDLELTSSGLGSNASVAVQVTSGTFDVSGGNGNGTANGVDAEATINGANVTADGLKFRVRSKAIDFDLELDQSFGTGAVDTISVSGDALSFQLSPHGGPKDSLSLGSVHAAHLGGQTGRLNEVATGAGKSLLEGDAATVVAIADEALAEVGFQQARVGAFSSITLDSAATTHKAQDSSLTQAISDIEDADAALETALLIQNQLISDNIASALAITVSQHASVVSLLQQVALSI